MRALGKILIGLLLLIIFAGALAFIFFKLNPEKALSFIMPEVTNVQVTGTQLRKGKMHMVVKANLSKKLIPFFLDSMTYQSVLYQDTVAKGKKDFESATDEGNTISLPLSVDYKTLVKKMKGHEGDSTLMGFAGQAYVSLPLLGTQKVNIHKQIPIRMMVFPEVKIDRIQVEKFGINDSRLKVNLKIHNPNYMAFSINDLKYRMNVKNYLTSKGAITKPYHIQAFKTTDLEIFMKSDIDKPLKAIWKGIKGDKFAYSMDMDMNIKPESKDFDSMKFKTTMEGSVSKSDLKSKM